MRYLMTALEKVYTQKFQRMFDPYLLVYLANTHEYIVYLQTFNVRMKRERVGLTPSNSSLMVQTVGMKSASMETGTPLIKSVKIWVYLFFRK